MPWFEPQKRDLQSETGPGASGAQQKHEKLRNTLKILQKRSMFFLRGKNIFFQKKKNVKSLQNGSGVVEMRLYFVRMISWGPRRSWDRFWPKKYGKTLKKQDFLILFLLEFPIFLRVPIQTAGPQFQKQN